MTNLRNLCHRLETAQAAQNCALAEALARLNPASGARCHAVKGGWAVYCGPGHMMNQGLALGLEGPLDADDLAQLEAALGVPVVLEVCAGADPGLGSLLPARGYHLRAFQHVWMRDLDVLLTPTLDPFRVTPIAPSEARLFTQVVMAGFMEQDALPHEGLDLFQPVTEAQGTMCFLAWQGGTPLGAGTLYVDGTTAVLSGTSVLPSHRGHGVQRALIRARLLAAQAKGCTLACSATLPHTPSQFNLQHEGFRIAYPKVEWVKSQD